MTQQFTAGDAIIYNMHGLRVPAIFIEMHDEMPTCCWITINPENGVERVVRLRDIRPAEQSTI